MVVDFVFLDLLLLFCWRCFVGYGGDVGLLQFSDQPLGFFLWWMWALFQAVGWLCYMRCGVSSGGGGGFGSILEVGCGFGVGG
jgi:hypothetical protein